MAETTGSAAGSTDNHVSVQEPVSGNGELGTGGEPDTQQNCRKCNHKKNIIVFRVILAVLSLALLIIIIVLSVQRYEYLSDDLASPASPACLDGWVGYQEKCYYFSEDQEDWASSQINCSALDASLAAIDSQQDMDFMVHQKGGFDHWIGLQRDTGHPWKWVNGTEFNNWFWIEGGGDCAYLNDQNKVNSSQCTDERHWICTKTDVFTKAKENSVDGGS